MRSEPTPPTKDRATRLIAVSLCTALLGTAWALDPFAEAAFDAPKRLIALCCAVLGASAWLLQTGRPAWQQWAAPARWVLALLLLALVGMLVATRLSPHQASAWTSFRTLALYALFLPLGASRALDGRQGALVYRVAVLAIVVNALLSLLQFAGWELPIPLTRIGGRLPTGALLGNEGYVALACALLAAASFAWALNAASRRARRVAWLLFALGVTTILLNRQLTSAIALALAVVALLSVRWNARWVVALGIAAVLCAATAALVPSVRDRTWAALPAGGLVGYQQLSTYRIAGWAAAVEMIQTRPWAGYGPGSYALESQRMRLAAELRWRARLLPPPTATTFVYAHQEYLQLAAETGVPVLVCLLLALATLISGMLKLARSPGATEALALLGVLIAGAVAALAWFPLQIPLTAIVLLTAAGRSWRLLADSTRGTA